MDYGLIRPQSISKIQQKMDCATFLQFLNLFFGNYSQIDRGTEGHGRIYPRGANKDDNYR